MKILLINHYAGSLKLGMEYRPYYLAREWVKAGHEVLIAGASFSHYRTIQPEFNGKYFFENCDGINYFWIKTPAFKGNGIGRIFNMGAFVFRLMRKSKYLSKTFNPDVVIASSTYPLDIYPARKIAKKSNAKLVFELHDLWPLSPMELGGYSKYHPFIMVLQKAENFVYKHADKVISILPKTFEHTVKHGLNPDKWHCVPNGVCLEEWDNTEKISGELLTFIESKRSQGYFLLGYVGTHGLANALDYLVEAAKLSENIKVFFVLVGKGNEKERLIQKSDGLNNIAFFDFIPKSSVPSLLKCFDALYIGWNKNPLYRFGISPNKIFDYMMAMKPVIHSVDAGNDLIKDANCGLSVPPENPEEIVIAIRKIMALNSDDLRIMGENGKKFVLENHDYRILAEKFLKHLS